MKKISLSVFVLLTLTTQNHFGQIGKLKDLKNKVSSGSSSSSSSTTVAVSAYDKAMKAAQKAEGENDYITAYKEYSKALEEKYNDYSAKSSRDRIEEDAIAQYNTNLNGFLDKKDCSSYQKEIDDLVATIVMTPTKKESWEKSKNECESKIQQQNAAVASEKSAGDYEKLSKGIYFENGFHTLNNMSSANIGDELWMNIKMDKTMMEYSADFGLESTFNAYGYFTIYMDGQKVAITKPFHFSSNYSKTWTDFDMPVAIAQDYGADQSKVAALVTSSQGVWATTTLQNESSLSRLYVSQAIKNFAPKNGPHKLKIEFGLGEKSGTEPKGTVASGEITINVNDAGKKELYKKGPKYLQPLDDNEKGSISLNNGQFKLGENNLTATITLPQAPKYYALKWCTTMSCDYDHGNLSLTVLLDGEEIDGYSELWESKWESQKSFTFTLLTKNDNDFSNDVPPFNEEDLFQKDRNNNFVYALADIIYSGKIKPGSHKVTIKVGHEVVVGNDKYNNIIAEKSFDISFTDAQAKSFAASSNAKKLSHAGGEWTSVDNHLKSLYSADRVTDVACYTEWKVTRNSLGIILYRTCRADVYYKTLDGGYRIWRAQEVKEDYNGSSYGKPYFVGHFRTDWGPTLLNNSHYPVPAIKAQ